MKTIIDDILEESIRTKKTAVEENREKILAAADRMAKCLASGHKILLFGNGGSAADAQHIAAEFINRFRAKARRASQVPTPPS